MTDDDGGAQRRHRNGTRRERRSRLEPAPKVWGEVGSVIAEAAEIHELGDACALGLTGDRLRCSTIDCSA